VCVYALILFLAYPLRRRVCIDSRNVKLYFYHTSRAKFVAKTMPIVPADRNSMPCSHCVSFTFVRDYCVLLIVFAFFVQCLDIAKVSQPSSNVAK